MNKSGSTITRTLVFGLLILANLIHFSYGQNKIDKLDQLIGAYVENGEFNGTVLVAEKGEIIYKKGFGMANIEWNIPNQPDTKNRLGSITKQFTAMLIMQLVEQGKLNLDVPISSYLPDYPKKNGDIITIHHLLTHSSGIPNFTDYRSYFNKMSHNSYSTKEMLNFFADSTLEFKPGARFKYSNSGYVLLGAIIEKVSDKSYEQMLQDNIFRPLKMINSGYDHHASLLKNRASGYDKNGATYINTSYIDMSVPFAAGALYSTVEDLYLWDQALYNNTLLKKANMDLLFTKHISSGGGFYGYGWGIDEIPIGNTNERIQTIGHGGAINGFNTLITRIPSDKSLIVLLSNAGGAPMNEMTRAITGIIYDKPYSLPKKSLAYSVAKVIEKDGLSPALSYYKKMKDSSGFRLNEGEMNSIGYEFLRSGKTKESAAIFKLNTEAFPNSSNVYDSYGEALLALGDKAQSIENYKKSVQLNPVNKAGIKKLQELGVNTDELTKPVKVSKEYLKLLEGDYFSINEPNRSRKIKFVEEEGVLVGNDNGYRYKLIPVGGERFVNPDDGASLIFDTKDKNAISLLLFGTIKLKKFVVKISKESAIKMKKDSIQLSEEKLLKYCGDYIDERMIPLSIVLKEKSIYRRLYNGVKDARLIPVSATLFIYDDDTGRTMEFTMTKKREVTGLTISSIDGLFVYEKKK